MRSDPILHQILARGEGFGHREHVELTWRHLQENDPDATRELVAEAIRQVAAEHDAPQKFHATITDAWVRCVAVHHQRWPAQTFERFIELNSDLLDPQLLERYFSRHLLFSDVARAAPIKPDILPLPALAA